VIVYAYSKWAEAVVMTLGTSAEQATRVMREIFARFGLVQQVHSDNGPQFTSDEFKQFLKANGIQQTSAPYHPATNGLAERFTRTLRGAVKVVDGIDIHRRLARFLLAHRNPPHATTGSSPAELFLGRPLRSRLDLVKPDSRSVLLQRQQQMSNGGRKERDFVVGDSVLVRNYAGKKGMHWRRGIVLRKLGSRTYSIQLQHGVIWTRHLNQLRRTEGEEEEQAEESQGAVS